MATIIRENTAEGGTHTTAVTTGNSGGLSGDAFATVNNTVTFDNTYPADGSLGYKFARATTENASVTFSDLAGLELTLFVRLYLRFDAIFGSSNLYIVTLTNGSGNVARLNLTSSGVLRMINGSATPVGNQNVTLSTGTLYRIEYRMVSHASAGTLDLRVYDGHSETILASDTASGLAIGSGNGANRFNFGAEAGAASGFTAFIDEIALADDDWIGPAVAAEPQLLYPDATETAGSWTATGAASIHAALAEKLDTSYATLTEANMPSTTRVRLEDGMAPEAGDRTWRARIGRDGTASVDFTVELFQGGGSTPGAGTSKGAITETITADFATFELVITEAITDYTDLYADLTADLT